MTNSKKASDEEVIAAYKKTGSVWKAGELLGMSGQSVHDRARSLGIIHKCGKYSEEEGVKIRDLYNRGFKGGDGQLDALCEEIGRGKPSVCKWAGQHGLTNARRNMDDSALEESSERMKEWHKNNEHPRGMKGKHHTDKVKSVLAKSTKAMWEEMSDHERLSMTIKQMRSKIKKHGSMTTKRKGCSWKSGWREIGGIRKYYRSRWEANYARYLQFLKEHKCIIDWAHEPETFWFMNIKRGSRSYLPDFRVVNTLDEDGEPEHIYYIEVKGWMDARSKTKLKRMTKYHPEVELRLVDSKAYKALEKRAGGFIPGWER